MVIPLGQGTPAGTGAHQANRPQADGRPGAVTTAPFGIGLPVFSHGSCPAGPGRLDEREPRALATARFGEHLASSADIVFADDDGAVFVPAGQAGPMLATARQISEVEQDQARRIRDGQTLRQQTTFDDYLARRAADPSYTFRRRGHRRIKAPGALPPGRPQEQPADGDRSPATVLAKRRQSLPTLSVFRPSRHATGRHADQPF